MQIRSLAIAIFSQSSVDAGSQGYLALHHDRLPAGEGPLPISCIYRLQYRKARFRLKFGCTEKISTHSEGLLCIIISSTLSR